VHLTRQTDFALRTLIFLASQPADALIQIRQICEVFDIPRNHLSKVVNKLANLGYVDSHRGRGGGIRLGREATDINIGALVRDMEPTLFPINCEEPACVLLPACRFRSVLGEASKAFINTLDGYALSDLMDSEVKVLLLADSPLGHKA
jgi:Rrf2 family transcriptional regulator, nitric oxide-sensitive transcriptional repressor